MTEAQPTAPYLGDLLKDSPSELGEVGRRRRGRRRSTTSAREQVLAAASGWSARARSSPCSGSSATRRATRSGRAARPAERTQILDESTGTATTPRRSPAACTTPTTRSTPSCRARRSTTPSATSGTAARSGTATTPGPRSAGWTKASVEPIAQRGVVGRGVLLDMARFRGKDNLDKGETFTHEDLMACAEAQGVEIQKRDILIIRTNFLQLFFEQGDDVLRGLLRARPGLQPRARAVVPGHGDPEPGHRHDRQRGDHRPQQRRRAGAAQRPDAQPRRRPSPRSPTWRSWPPTAPRTGGTRSSTSPRR